MAVFTTFSRGQLERFLAMFDLGELVAFEPIEEGIENTNYVISVERGDFVLTLFETLGFDDLPYFTQLLSHLHHNGLPVAEPCRSLDGMTSTIFRGKPAMLFPRLKGSHLGTVASCHCEIIGRTLAEFHEISSRSDLRRENPYHLDWLKESMSSLDDRMSQSDKVQVQQIIKAYELLCRKKPGSLPKGTIHGDLFKDNALFQDDVLTGVLDLYHACDDYLVQDLAITVNDWCVDGTGKIDADLLQSLLAGYQSVRPLTATEHEHWRLFLQLAALRFWLTRLLGTVNGEVRKDPLAIKAVLLHHLGSSAKTD